MTARTKTCVYSDEKRMPPRIVLPKARETLSNQNGINGRIRLDEVL
jgi:hypothetical protein